jgi:hypothetical protein
MTETSIIEPGSSLWTPARLPGRQARRDSRSTRLLTWPALPEVRPGQLWLAALPSTGPELALFEYRVLTTANVIIYDRGLASPVARFLPLGGYAEPAAPNAAWERCLRFARDGWSVARLVQPGGEFRHLSELALSPEMPGDRRVAVFANRGGGVYENSEARLDDLVYFDRSSILTVVCETIGGAAAPHLSVASTNGLAG